MDGKVNDKVTTYILDKWKSTHPADKGGYWINLIRFRSGFFLINFGVEPSLSCGQNKAK